MEKIETEPQPQQKRRNWKRSTKVFEKSKMEEEGLIIVSPEKFSEHESKVYGKYLTHDNGGRSFQVSFSRTGEYRDHYKVTVGKRPEFESQKSSKEWDEIEENKIGWDYPVLEIPNATRILVGYDEKEPGFGDGNSVLIELERNNYIFVGTAVYGFTLEDQVKKYFSPIGNNDVPYPYAVTKSGKYLLMEDFPPNMESIPLMTPPENFEEDPYWNNKLKKSQDVKIYWIDERLN